MPSERIQRRIDALLDEAESAFASRDWARLQALASDARLDRGVAFCSIRAEGLDPVCGQRVLWEALLATERAGRFGVSVDVELKGLAGTHRVFPVRWEGSP